MDLLKINLNKKKSLSQPDLFQLYKLCYQLKLKNLKHLNYFKVLLLFFFKKGKKKRFIYLFHKLFFKKTRIKNHNFNQLKQIKKLLLNNTSNINQLPIRRGRRKKIVFYKIVPILKRVQKRLQAQWIINDLKKYENNSFSKNWSSYLENCNKTDQWISNSCKTFYGISIKHKEVTKK